MLLSLLYWGSGIMVIHILFCLTQRIQRIALAKLFFFSNGMFKHYWIWDSLGVLIFLELHCYCRHPREILPHLFYPSLIMNGHEKTCGKRAFEILPSHVAGSCFLGYLFPHISIHFDMSQKPFQIWELFGGL